MKYGFIYIWFDKKHKRYYIGRHWGTEDDGYICSSTGMRNAYKRRPKDFKRRIIKKIFTTKEDLIKEEQVWLNMIKPDECGTKYYNKTRRADTPSTKGYKHPQKTIEKIRKSNTGKKRSLEARRNISNGNKRPCSESRKEALRKPRTDEFKRKVSNGLKLAWEEGRFIRNKK